MLSEHDERGERERILGLPEEPILDDLKFMSVDVNVEEWEGGGGRKRSELKGEDD